MLRRRDSLFLFFLLGIAVIMMLYSSYIGIRNIFRYNVTKNELNLTQVELFDLQQKNFELNEALSSLENSQYWELLSKRKLGYKKTGEIVYMFVNNGDVND